MGAKERASSAMAKMAMGAEAPHVPVSRRAFVWLLAAILAFSLVSKMIHLAIPTGFYFDEHYHGYTATHMLHGDAQAYNPWAKNPPESAMEWTHPPLAKLIMAAMMIPFGENSFGWRIGSVLFGTLAIGLTALVALELFTSPFIALAAAGLMSVEGLLFAQSRIAMNDSYFVCFGIFSILYYIRWKKNRTSRELWLLGLGLGLAAATKWTALYLFLILAVDLGRDYLHTTHRKELPIQEMALKLLALPAVIYFLSYSQLFLLGGGLTDFITLQKQMWYYHSGLGATHSYQSVPWQWILNLRPIWMYAGSPGPGLTANIYNMGNSVVLLSGLVAVYWLLFMDQVKNWSRWFVLLCYFMLWLPWCLSPRIMFFYHYAPAIPFLCIILGKFLEHLLTQPAAKPRRWAIGIGCAAVLWFVVFYPDVTGIPVSQGFADRIYFALPSWK
jgi:dolichyl-phosphate-mannose-protein mannosyltransferase